MAVLRDLLTGDDMRQRSTMGQITPVETEIGVSNQITPELEKAHEGLSPDRNLQSYVTFVGRRMLPYSTRASLPHSFRLLNSTGIINAFALGNGNVYLTRGLLALLRDEAELAAVLGHEMAHVKNRDIAHNLDMMAVSGLILQALSPGSKRAMAETVAGIVSGGFSREQELKADADGMRMASSAGYDPQGLVRVLSAFQKLEPKVEGLDAFFLTHPQAGRRIGEVEAQIAKLRLGSGVTMADRFAAIVLRGEPLASALAQPALASPPGRLPILPIATAAGLVLATVTAGALL